MRKFLYLIGIPLGSIACVFVAFLGYIFLWPAASEYFNRMPFDSALWKTEEMVESEENPVRIKMVNDLMSRYELKGMSRKEIDELLGVPRPKNYFKDVGMEYVYWLGPERRAFSIDSEWLGIKFQNNVVTEAQLLRD